MKKAIKLNKLDTEKKRPRRGGEPLEVSRSRGLEVTRVIIPENSTPIPREVFRQNTTRQDPTLFDGDPSYEYIQYRDEIKDRDGKPRRLISPGLLGLNLTNDGDLVFREMVKTAIKQAPPELLSIIRDKQPQPIAGRIRLSDLARSSFGYDTTSTKGNARGLVKKNGSRERTLAALGEFLESAITIKNPTTGKIAIHKLITTTGAIYTPGKEFEEGIIEYVLSPFLTKGLANDYVLEPERYGEITRGKRLPNFANKLRDILWSAFYYSDVEIFRKNKRELLDNIIVLEGDIKRYKKDPQRRGRDLDKVIKRFQEIELIVPGTHEENGKRVEDLGYWETKSKRGDGIICNFRRNPNPPTEFDK